MGVKKLQKMTDTKRITLQSIADITGYSKNTTSLALRDSKRLPKKTRELIQQEAKKLGYIPNFIAKNFSKNKSGLIGIYTRALYDSVRTEIINNLISYLRSSDYCPILGLGQDHTGPWYTSPWAETLRSLHVDALVVVSEVQIEISNWFQNTPIIGVSCQPNVSLRCDYVGLDRYEAADLAVDYLIEKNHRNILLCTDKKLIFGEGCYRRLVQKQCKVYWSKPDFPIKVEQLPALVSYVKNNLKKFSAIIFGDAPLAAQFLTLLTKENIAIPQDISILSYDYLPYAKDLKVHLTTIQQPIAEMAEEAIKLIWNRIKNPDSAYIQKVLKHKIMPGDSA